MCNAFGLKAGSHALIFFLASSLVMPVTSLAADTVFFVVRHAEKESGNGDVTLSSAGQKRAKQLTQTLENLRIDTIYHTNVKRTKETATPLATKLSIAPVIYNDPSPQWINGIVSAQQGKRVLIVGHSDTVPDIVSRLVGHNVSPIGDQFDNLFVVVISGNNKSMVHLKYGEAN